MDECCRQAVSREIAFPELEERCVGFNAKQRSAQTNLPGDESRNNTQRRAQFEDLHARPYEGFDENPFRCFVITADKVAFFTTRDWQA